MAELKGVPTERQTERDIEKHVKEGGEVKTDRRQTDTQSLQKAFNPLSVLNPVRGHQRALGRGSGVVRGGPELRWAKVLLSCRMSC